MTSPSTSSPHESEGNTFAYTMGSWFSPGAVGFVFTIGIDVFFVIGSFSGGRAEPLSLLLLLPLGLTANAFAYFMFPPRITVTTESVRIRYLLGPTVSFPRESVTCRVSPTGLTLTVRDGTWRSFVMGRFSFYTGLMSEGLTSTLLSYRHCQREPGTRNGA